MAPWAVACQPPLSVEFSFFVCVCVSVEFSRQEYWSTLPFPIPGDLPNTETEPVSLVSPELAVRFFTTGTTLEAHVLNSHIQRHQVE